MLKTPVGGVLGGTENADEESERNLLKEEPPGTLFGKRAIQFWEN